jgi:chromosome segregation ATPase
MLTEKQLEQLKAENELLQLQLEEVNEIIAIREEELAILRQKLQQTTQLQSKLDMNLLEFEQMQNNIGKKQQEAAGASLRMEELENELYSSIRMEKNYYSMLDENVSLQANLKDTNSELEEAASLYKKVRQLNTALTETKSNLDIAQMEIESLRAELKEYREQDPSSPDKKL